MNNKKVTSQPQPKNSKLAGPQSKGTVKQRAKQRQTNPRSLRGVREGIKLLWSVGSLTLITIAGAFAQSKAPQTLESARVASVATVSTVQTVETVHATQQGHQAQAVTPQSSHSKFALNQIAKHEVLLSSLTERAEVTPELSRLPALKAALLDLDSNIDKSRKMERNFSRLNQKADEAARADLPFVQEDLRATLFDLQESGIRAVSIVRENDPALNRDSEGIVRPVQTASRLPR